MSQYEDPPPTKPTRFSIHGLLMVEIEAGFPFGQGVSEELASFLTFDRGRAPDVLVTSDTDDAAPRCSASGVYEYTDQTTWIVEYDVAVSATEGGFQLSCRRDPLPFMLPMIQHGLLSRGQGLIHAAAVAREGRAVAIPAWGGTGKTSAIVELTRLPGIAFLSDDFCILSADGTLLSFPKPFYVYPFHRPIFPHLFRKKHKPLVPAVCLPMLHKLREASRPVFMKHPRLERLARRITPEHMKVPARVALPDARFVERSTLHAVLFAGRYSGDKVCMEPYDRERAARRIVGNWIMEIGAPARELLIGCCATSLWSMDHFVHELYRITVAALARVEVFDLRLPQSLPPAETAKEIAGAVQRVL